MSRLHFPKISLMALLVVAIVGCGDDTVVTPVFSDPDAIESTAGNWRTWVVSSAAGIRPSSPPAGDQTSGELSELRTLASQRTDEIKENIDHWNRGNAANWNELQRALIAKNKTNPPRASRGLALVSIAMYDAVVASWNAKFYYLRARPYDHENGPSVYGTKLKSPSYVSERAAMGAAASDLLKYLFASDADTIDQAFEDAKNADLYSGTHFRSDVTAGEALGHRVADLVLARANNDNSGAPYTGTPLTGGGYWEPTPPAFIQDPLEPACGKWKTWILANGAEIRPEAPPAYSSDEFEAQLEEVWEVNQGLTDDRLEIAYFWADGAGSATPPGHWNQIAVDLALEAEMNEPRTARMLAFLGAAQADAFISCWDCKYAFWCVRPITEIRKKYQADWLSPITTPPFPSFPSGHSTTSGAASTLLGYFFPEKAVWLQSQGMEAMMSRLYGGIHFTFDNFTGFNMGAAIGTRAIARAARDGAPKLIPTSLAGR